MNRRSTAVLAALQSVTDSCISGSCSLPRVDEEAARQFINTLFDAGFVLEPRTSGMRK